MRADPRRPGAARWLCAIGFTAALLSVAALPAAAQSAKRWTCVFTRTGEQRLIELEYPTNDVVPCLATDRLGGGAGKVIADYSGTRGRCESTVESVLRNLGRAGYQCTGPVDFGGAAAPVEAAAPEPPADAAPAPEARPPAASDAAAAPARSEAPARTEPVLSASQQRPQPPAEPGGYFAIASTHVLADRAQRAAADVRLAMPFADVRVMAPREGAPYWSVALAANASQEDAEATVAVAREEGFGRLPFVWTFPADWPPDRRYWLAAADEWPPMVVRDCHDRGASTVREMAACSGLRVEPETFVACMTGGVCRPGSVGEAEVAGLDDRELPAVPPAGGPHVAPMIATPAAVEACADVGGADGAAFVTCMAVAMMDAGQQTVLGCRGTARTPAAVAACASLATTPEARIVAECLDAGIDDSLALVACAGGRITARELARCASLGREAAACLGAAGMLAPALREIARDLGPLGADGAGSLRTELEQAAASLAQGDADAAEVRATLKDLADEIRSGDGGDPRIAGAFDAVAPRLPLR